MCAAAPYARRRPVSDAMVCAAICRPRAAAGTCENRAEPPNRRYVCASAGARLTPRLVPPFLLIAVGRPATVKSRDDPGRAVPKAGSSAAEQPLEPAEESAALARWCRLRCGRGTAGRWLRCRLRAARGWRPGRRRRGLLRHGRATRPDARPSCLLHLLVVTTQDGIRRHQASCLLHLLVMSEQNGICRCGHNRLLSLEAHRALYRKSHRCYPESRMVLVASGSESDEPASRSVDVARHDDADSVRRIAACVRARARSDQRDSSGHASHGTARAASRLA